MMLLIQFDIPARWLAIMEFRLPLWLDEVQLKHCCWPKTDFGGHGLLATRYSTSRWPGFKPRTRRWLMLVKLLVTFGIVFYAQSEDAMKGLP